MISFLIYVSLGFVNEVVSSQQVEGWKTGVCRRDLQGAEMLQSVLLQRMVSAASHSAVWSLLQFSLISLHPRLNIIMKQTRITPYDVIHH